MVLTVHACSCHKYGTVHALAPPSGGHFQSRIRHGNHIPFEKLIIQGALPVSFRLPPVLAPLPCSGIAYMYIYIHQGGRRMPSQ